MHATMERSRQGSVAIVAGGDYVIQQITLTLVRDSPKPIKVPEAQHSIRILILFIHVTRNHLGPIWIVDFLEISEPGLMYFRPFMVFCMCRIPCAVW